jgi:hypothetical protein
VDVNESHTSADPKIQEVVVPGIPPVFLYSHVDLKYEPFDGVFN